MAEKSSRRTFLAASSGTLLSMYFRQTGVALDVTSSPNEQVVAGYIGCGIRFHSLIGQGCRFGPCAAVCDVDAVQRGRGLQSAMNRHYDAGYPMGIYNYEDYRHVLDRKDIDAVIIATPDHWHTKMAVDALRAGKNVYCEKPLTLTIREGQQLQRVAEETGRVLQVGTQQRTEMEKRFPTAVATIRDRRIGNIRRVTCAIGGSETCPPLPITEPPKHLNWDAWLGQAPRVDYRESPTIVQQAGYGAGHPYSRTHNYFRWWYEYSGGKLTDWGAHHVDIAMWALNKSDGAMGRYRIEPLMVEHPVPFMDGMPRLDDRFNTATAFHARVTFADGIVLDVRHRAGDLGFDNGIMFEGGAGRIFVNRGKLSGRPVEDLATNPLPDNALWQLYGKEPPADHMTDFVDCIRHGGKPASDVASHHRHLTVCHAINIALRLNRPLTFDPSTERFVDDEQANGFVARPQRRGYEIDA